MSATRLADFGGARVAILEARMGQEVQTLVRRFGGEPVLAPALRESPVAAAAAVGEAIDRLSEGEPPIIVFQTGVGVDAFFDGAAQLGRASELRKALDRAVIVGRGPKPASALAKLGLRPTVAVASPYTTAELVEALKPLPLAGASVILVHYGEANARLAEALEDRGARVFNLLLYEWLLPTDTGPLERLVDELLAGTIEVVAFTSQVQIRHLFSVAGEVRREALTAALGCTVVGAIGPTCAAAANEFGVPVAVTPLNPKLVPLFKALAEVVAERNVPLTRSD